MSKHQSLADSQTSDLASERRIEPSGMRKEGIQPTKKVEITQRDRRRKYYMNVVE